MDFAIRPARRGDLDEITALWYELATMHEGIMEGYDLGEEPVKEWKRLMRDCFDRKDMITFVAVEENTVIGFASVILRNRAPFFRDRHMGVIMDVYVKRERRGEGIGTKLVSGAERWIKNKGIDLTTVTVAPENEEGVKFWSKMGYKTYLLKQRKEL